jgi:hypothetical protein
MATLPKLPKHLRAASLSEAQKKCSTLFRTLPQGPPPPPSPPLAGVLLKHLLGATGCGGAGVGAGGRLLATLIQRPHVSGRLKKVNADMQCTHKGLRSSAGVLLHHTTGSDARDDTVLTVCWNTSPASLDHWTSERLDV